MLQPGLLRLALCTTIRIVVGIYTLFVLVILILKLLNATRDPRLGE